MGEVPWSSALSASPAWVSEEQTQGPVGLKKAKWLSKEGLQITEKEEKQKAKEKRKDIPIWVQNSKESQGEIRKPSSVISAKK